MPLCNRRSRIVRGCHRESWNRSLRTDSRRIGRLERAFGTGSRRSDRRFEPTRGRCGSRPRSARRSRPNPARHPHRHPCAKCERRQTPYSLRLCTCSRRTRTQAPRRPCTGRCRRGRSRPAPSTRRLGRTLRYGSRDPGDRELWFRAEETSTGRGRSGRGRCRRSRSTSGPTGTARHDRRT